MITDSNKVVRHLICDLVLKARMLEQPRELDSLIDETVNRLFRAVHVQDSLLSEREVANRYPFFTLTMLRNMRFRGTGPSYIKFGPHKNSRVAYRLSDLETWIVAHYQLQEFVDTHLEKTARS